MKRVLLPYAGAGQGFASLKLIHFTALSQKAVEGVVREWTVKG
jgi:hypothetical protein